MCLSREFRNIIILFNSWFVQSRLEICISWYLHEFISKLMVVNKANRIYDIGWYCIRSIYLARFGYLVIVLCGINVLCLVCLLL